MNTPKKTNKMHEFKLIDGSYSKEEAQEILMGLIAHKVQFHNTKIFSEEERFGTINQDSVKRIEELKTTGEKVKFLLNQSTTENKRLKIESIINVELVEIKETVN